MNRKFINYFEGVVVLHVTGRKIERFLSYLYKMKINLLSVECINREKLLVRVFKRDLEKITNMKTTYDVSVVAYEGKLKLKQAIRKHLFLLLSIIVGYVLLLLLSNVIFDVEVIHSNVKIRELITDELANHNIKKWHLKQNFNDIEKIKKEILNNYKDRLEWLEIENVGTKYIVKVEERKLIKKDTNYIFQDIVSTKNAIIMKIEAIEGEIIRQKNDYVKKGDVIISGKIMKGSEVSKLVKASGKIYGEVWYNIKVEHPLIYRHQVLTGRKKDVYQIVLFNHNISLFNFKPFISEKSEYHIIAEHPLIPFKIIKNKQSEIIVEDEIYTDGEALIKAEKNAVQKMTEYLSDDEYIISQRKLKYHTDEQKLYLEMFFKVYENIGEPREIIE